VKILYHTEELLDVLGFPLCYADTVTMIPLFTVVTSSATSTQIHTVSRKFQITSALMSVQNIPYFMIYKGCSINKWTVHNCSV